MPTTDATATVRALIAAIPENSLRDLITELVLTSLTLTPPSLAEPKVRRKGGWPRGRPRGTATTRQRGTEGSTKRSVDPPLTVTGRMDPSPQKPSGDAANRSSPARPGASSCASSTSNTPSVNKLSEPAPCHHG